METTQDAHPKEEPEKQKGKRKENLETQIESLSRDDLKLAANLVIRGSNEDLDYMELLAKRLKAESLMSQAAELYYKMLDKIANKPLWRKELAICLYKDPDLPSSLKFAEALRQMSYIMQLPDDSRRDDHAYVMAGINLLETSEYLGVTGAIFKRWWQYDNQYKNLLYSEHFYQKGMEEWRRIRKEAREKKLKEIPDDDDAGYCALNYAFICDLLSQIREEQTAGLFEARKSESGMQRLKIAQEIRREIVEELLGSDINSLKHDASLLEKPNVNGYNKVWAQGTLGEAFFGLGHYDLAKNCYESYRRLTEEEFESRLRKMEIDEVKIKERKKNTVNWKMRSTAEQLLWLAEVKMQIARMDKKGEDALNEIRDGANDCMKKLFPKNWKNPNAKVDTTTVNRKVGLALSGGGFRASLYHIGVLAKLAEKDILRYVEVISCVSGGSILGTHYYLLLKRKFEVAAVEGRSLEKTDYIDVVKQLETEFLAAVQKNMRCRIFLDLLKNFKIFFDKSYTRTHRLAELYEEHFYSKAMGKAKEEPIYMQEIKVNLKDADNQIFNPKTGNWSRMDKVPMLVLNATTLNTGHNWQFTASWMGEPPANIRQDVDVRKRLRRMYYDQAPEPYKNKVRLGQAVGASSCVPVLFEPLRLPGLYPGIDLQLVDGGVHDNQGIASILEQECKVVIVSDASAQMPDTDAAAKNEIGVFMRSDLVFQERIRESQILDLKARENATQIRALGLVHLQKDLTQPPVNWTDSDEATRRVLRGTTPNPDEDLTSYGVPYRVQEALAQIRTDLDCFHDAEAYSLMYSGYQQMSKQLELENFREVFSTQQSTEGNKAGSENAPFAFMAVRLFMEQAHKSAELADLLKHSKRTFFKAFFLSKALQATVLFMALLLVGGSVWAATCYIDWNDFFSGKGGLFWTLTVLIIFISAYYAGVVLEKLTGFRLTWMKYFAMIPGIFVLFLIFRLQLSVLDRLYRKAGKLENIGKKSIWARRWERIRNFI